MIDVLRAEIECEELGDGGSLNHSAIQVNLAFLLKKLGAFSVYTELSLDTSTLDKTKYKFKEEIKPDVCIYPKRGLSRPYDILKMTEMPILAIEILSPKLVIVYRALDERKVFATGEVIDEIIGIRLPFDEIFDA